MLWLRLLGIWGWLKKGLTALAGLVGRYPLQAALIASLCLSGWLWRGRQEARVNAAKWETAYGDQKLAYEKAQLLAAAKQADADRREFALKSSLAEKADALSRSVAVASRSAVAAYARAHPVSLCKQTPDSAASGPGDTSVPGDPGQFPGEKTNADWLAITRSDLDALADHTMQGAVKTEFLNAAVAAGWAIPQSKVELPMPELSVQP